MQTPTPEVDADPQGRPGDIAMIFEFWFDPERPDIRAEYLTASDAVRRHLDGMDGFRGVERFQSTTDPDKFVAVGFFADEAAVRSWRTTPAHRRAQHLGRTRFFTRYRLRMATVTRDYDRDNRVQAPPDSRRFHADANLCGDTPSEGEHEVRR